MYDIYNIFLYKNLKYFSNLNLLYNFFHSSYDCSHNPKVINFMKVNDVLLNFHKYSTLVIVDATITFLQLYAHDP